MELIVVDGKFVVSPVVGEWSLAALLADITPDNVHTEVETGDVFGAEAW